LVNILTRGVQTVWGSHIFMTHREGTNDSMVIESVMEYDEYQAKNISYKDGNVFIDLGSHIGTWSVLMGVKNPTFKIYSYEAIPNNYEIIHKNIELNKLNNVMPFLLAVSDRSDEIIKIYHNDESTPFNSQHRFIGSMEGSSDDYYATPSISLNDIFKNNNIDRCRVIKTDCEGCELKAFASLTPDNINKIDYVIGEYHPFGMGMEDFFKLFRNFDSLLPFHGNELQNFIFKNKEAQ